MEYDVLAEGAKQRRNITLAKGAIYKAYYDVSFQCFNITRRNMTLIPMLQYYGVIIYYDILLNTKALHKA